MKKPFKTPAAEREFWETQDLTKLVHKERRRDTHVTRTRRWVVNAYLSPEEGLALEEFAARAGESKSDVIREALRQHIRREKKARSWNADEVRARYLKGIDAPDVTGRLKSITVTFPSDAPNRDVDLARKLKSVLLIAFPGAHVICYAKDARRLGTPSDRGRQGLADEPELRSDLSEFDQERVRQAARAIALATIGDELVERHPPAPRRAVAGKR